MKQFYLSFSIIASLVFLVMPIKASAVIPGDVAATQCKPSTDTGVLPCNLDATTPSTSNCTGCKCGYMTEAGTAPNTYQIEVVCPNNSICSRNEYHTFDYNVCLKRIRQSCLDEKATPAPQDAMCEGGTICDPNSKVCKVDTGDTTLAGPLGSTTTDIRDAVRRFINIALGFLGVITVVMIIYGGVLWLTAAGADEKVTKGKHTLIWAAIGAIVISIAWTISSYVLQIGKTVG